MPAESPEARAARITAELRAATAEAAGVLKDLTAARHEAVKVTASLATDAITNTIESLLGPRLERIGLRIDELDAQIVARFNESMIALQAHIEHLIKTNGTLIIDSYKTTREQMMSEGRWPLDLS